MIAAKHVRLDEIVGQLKGEKEEEPEGKVLGNSNTGSLSYSFPLPISYSFPLPNTLLIQFKLVLFILPSLFFFSDDSEGEVKKRRPLMQEEEDIDMIRSWVKVRGDPAHQEEEVKELLAEVKHIPMSLSFVDLSATNFPHNL